MAKWWRENFTPKDHTIYSRMLWHDSPVNQNRISNPHQTNLIQHYVYFVQVAKFTFEFYSLDELRDCLAFYEQKLIPPFRALYGFHDESQTWYQRLPRYLHDESKRTKVITALQRALDDFSAMDVSKVLPPSIGVIHARADQLRQKRRESEKRTSLWITGNTTNIPENDEGQTYHVKVGVRHLTFKSIDELHEIHRLLKEGYYFVTNAGFDKCDWRYSLKRIIDIPITQEIRRLIRVIERAIKLFEIEHTERKQE